MLRKSLLCSICLILIGCGSTPRIIEKPVLVYSPPKTDTLYLKDTVTALDSLWYSEITDSLGKVIGELRVYYQKRLAELSYKAKTETVYVKIPVKDSSSSLNAVSPIVISLLTGTEKAILFGAIGIILSAFLYFRARGGRL